MLLEGLSTYNLVPFLKNIIWVSDRGSNIKKVLEEEEVVFCSGHRINNILEKVFFQNEEKNKREEKKKITQQSINKFEQLDDEVMNEVEPEQSSEDEDDEKNFPNQREHASKHRKRTIGKKSNETAIKVNHLTILKSEIPSDAKRVIDLIISSKELVHYVKLVRIEEKSLD